MSKNLHIEEGCLAIVVQSSCGNMGLVVTVGHYMGHVGGWDGNNHWRVHTDKQDDNGDRYHADESQLMRIDGFKAEENKLLEEVV